MSDDDVKQRAKNSARAVLKNLEGRSGVGNALDEVERDIYREIERTLARIIAEEFTKTGTP